MNKLFIKISLIVIVIILSGCSHTEVTTSINTATQTSENVQSTTSAKTENKLITLQDILNEFPVDKGNAKSTSQLSKEECMNIGNDLADRYHKLTYNYFSGVWATSGYVNCTNNTNTNIDLPLRCIFTDYSSLEELAKDVSRCMSVTVFSNTFGKSWYAECNGQIYNNDNDSGWVYSSACYLTSYEIIDEDTIKFIFTVDDDPNEPKHNCDFIAGRNEGIWRVEKISDNTSATIMYQFVLK